MRNAKGLGFLTQMQARPLMLSPGRPWRWTRGPPTLPPLSHPLQKHNKHVHWSCLYHLTLPLFPLAMQARPPMPTPVRPCCFPKLMALWPCGPPSVCLVFPVQERPLMLTPGRPLRWTWRLSSRVGAWGCCPAVRQARMLRRGGFGRGGAWAGRGTAFSRAYLQGPPQACSLHPHQRPACPHPASLWPPSRTEFPRMTNKKSIGQGVQFLNRNLSSYFFSHAGDPAQA